jgi:hypothetical protein
MSWPACQMMSCLPNAVQVSMSVAAGGKGAGAGGPSAVGGMLGMFGLNQCGADFQRK